MHAPGTPKVPASALRNEGAGQRGRRSRSSKTLKPCCKLESGTKYVRSTTKAGFWNSLHCLRLRCPCGRHGEHSLSHAISLLASRRGRQLCTMHCCCKKRRSFAPRDASYFVPGTAVARPVNMTDEQTWRDSRVLRVNCRSRK